MTDLSEHDADAPPAGTRPPSGAGFLIAQVGALGSRMFASRIAALGVSAAQSGLLRAVAREQGRSQTALAAELGVRPSRLVVLVDELESDGLVERRPHPTDRRQRGVFLTGNGRGRLDDLRRAATEHERDLCRSLSVDERERLRELLSRIADDHGLTRGVHPGHSTS